MFGYEQGFVQSRFLLRLVYFIFGEFRYPIRLRAIMLRRSIPKKFSAKVIWDAGCGEGQTSFWLSRRFANAKIIGTDIKRENIKHCENIAHYMTKRNNTFMQKDILESRFRNIDLIVCFEVLEHIDNYGKALNIFSDSLVPGGLLVIHTPADNYFQSPNWGLRRFMHAEERGTVNEEVGQYHIRSGYDLDKLAGKIESMGFTIYSKHYTFGPIAMFAHTIYEWTRSRSKIWQIITLWPLVALGYLDMWFSFSNGGGVLIVAEKK